MIDDSTLIRFVTEQLHPWRDNKLTLDHAGETYSQIARHRVAVKLFRLDGHEVEVLPGEEVSDPWLKFSCEERASRYELLFSEALSQHPTRRPMIIALDLMDSAPEYKDVPVFTFQKVAGSNNPLVPDVEIITSSYFEATLEDDLPFEDKATRAVFSGSTTGGGLISMDAAMRSEIPRLRAAEFFQDVPGIDFQLAQIVQCETPDVETYLRGRGFGGRRIDWQETYQSKFGISIDGNGAACSRPAIILRSRGVLLKYASVHELYWFSALVPWKHFIPIHRDEDVIRVIREEEAAPGRYASIAAEGRKYARRILSRRAVLSYTSAILMEYEKMWA